MMQTDFHPLSRSENQLFGFQNGYIVKRVWLEQLLSAHISPKNRCIFFFLVILFLRCDNRSELKNFTYTYTMESTGVYKVELQITSDTIFRIRSYNYFFDNFEKEKRSIVKEGKLSEKEFATFKQLLIKSRLGSMKDSYGFDTPTNTGISVIYIFHLKQGEKEKYVSVKENSSENFSVHFIKLIDFTNTFINAEK